MITDPTNLVAFNWAEGCLAYTLFENENFSVKQETMSPGTAEQLHKHQHVHQLFYILQGEAVFVLNTHNQPLSSGKFITVCPGDVHQIRNNTEEQLIFLVISSPPVTTDRINL